ncbi:MAG: hypothetical protein GC146_06730 [Limimaricola sp.]|uniref:hypothetical protein n=1 Tax=Limimaricola sp. TaxID=2211665 RepID=UPI001DDE12CF|nr:hypothetical protein [Limimaricola sp.]MBI1416900.1 hypothetical protein [Limimaricola sp.]
MKFLVAAVLAAFLAAPVLADVSVSQVRAASSRSALLALGATPLTAQEFRSLVVGRSIDAGSWTWQVSADGTYNSVAKDGSWQPAHGHWEMQGDRYCRATDGRRLLDCAQVFLAGTALRLVEEDGHLSPWTMALPPAAVAVLAGARAFNGIYRPAGADGAAWSCDPTAVGQPAGAMAIDGGVLHAPGRRCTLSDPQAGAGDAVRFAAACTGDGATEMVLRKEPMGLVLTVGGTESHWSRCTRGPMAGPPASDGQWSYADHVASVSWRGAQLDISCAWLSAGSTTPTARLRGPAMLADAGATGTVRFSVDGQPGESFAFLSRGADGWVSDLAAAAQWSDGLIPALMYGWGLTLYQNGAELAAFPLRGSQAALTRLRSECQ